MPCLTETKSYALTCTLVHGSTSIPCQFNVTVICLVESKIKSKSMEDSSNRPFHPDSDRCYAS